MLASSLLFSFILVLAVTPSLALASGKVASQNSVENCTVQADEIKSNTLVEDILMHFGGIQALIGQYKMRGLIGALANTKVESKVEENLFWVSVNGDKFKQVHLCRDTQATSAKSAHVLKLKVLQPRTPQNGMILVRPGSKQDQLLVSAHRSNWKFMKFKKIKTAAKVAAIQ